MIFNFFEENYKKDKKNILKLKKECYINRPDIDFKEKKENYIIPNKYYITKRLLEHEEEKMLIKNLNIYKSINFYSLMQIKEFKLITIELLNMMREINRTKPDLEENFDKIVEDNITIKYIYKKKWFNIDFLNRIFILNYNENNDTEEDTIDTDEEVVIEEKDNTTTKRYFKKISFERKRELINSDIEIILKKIEIKNISKDDILILNQSLMNIGLNSSFLNLFILNKEELLREFEIDLNLKNDAKIKEYNDIFKYIHLSNKLIKEIMDILVGFNIKLIIKESVGLKKKIVSQLSFNELLNVGILGFLYALQKFNVSKDLKLSTYVSNWIKQYIIKYINANKSLIVSSTYYISKKIEYNNLMREEKNKDLTDKEIAKYLKINEKQLNYVLKYTNHSDVSIYQPLGNGENGGDDFELKDTLIDENEEDIDQNIEYNFYRKILLDIAEKTLNDKEKYIFKYTSEYYSNNTVHFEDICKNINLTSARVRQLCINIETKLIDCIKTLMDNANTLNIGFKKYYSEISEKKLLEIYNNSREND